MEKRGYCSAARTAGAERTRDRILASAGEILGTAGIGAFSLEAVGTAAGVTRATVYKHFGSRRALLEAIFDDLAARAGLYRLPEAMTESEPLAALERVIEIFCEFWTFDPDAMARLYGFAGSDAEFGDVLQARNDRRRRLLATLVGRMQARGEVRKTAARELVDMLFALTAFSFHAALYAGRRSRQRVRQMVQDAAGDAVRRASWKSKSDE